MKSIIFIAPPAAGKGTQAVMLSSKFNIPHISTGDILRNASSEETERGKYIKNLISNGKFVDDNIMLELIKERLQNCDCDNGYILDGFPRSLEQAQQYEEILKELSKELGFVIVLDIDKEVAKNRIVGRISCSKCGSVFNENIKEANPKVTGICDKCGSKLTKRSDDNEETFVKRFDTYLEKTKPLINYYENKNVLYHVNSDLGKENTFKQIENIIVSSL
ncbi:MAG: adenylate kinase [Bacilli bacterium]